MLQFTNLSIQNKHLILDHVKEYESYSDYNFASLFHWNVQERIQFAFVKKALVLKMTDYISGSEFLTILGSEDIDEAIIECKQTAEALNIDTALRLVPEVTIKNIRNIPNVIIEEDIDSHDYILDVDSLAEMRASVYRGKRNLLNRFHRLYEGQAKAVELDLTDENVKNEVLSLAEEWRHHTKQNEQDTINEFIAIERSVQHAHHLQVRGFGIYVQDKLVAFSIIEDLPEYGVMLHFDKANTDYIGIYEYLKNELALYLQKNGVKWINFQQDLGIEGLRNMKESYKPIKKLKKHTVKL